jgi:hypothetical protein
MDIAPEHGLAFESGKDSASEFQAIVNGYKAKYE